MVDIPVTERLRRVALIIWSTIGGLILAGAVFWLASQIRIIWLPLAFAGGLVLILNPIVRALQRAHIHRIIGTFFAFGLLGAVLVTGGFLVVPVVEEQAAQFAAQIPQVYERMLSLGQDLGRELGFELGPALTLDRVQEWAQDPANQQAIQDFIGGFGSGAGRLLRGVVEAVVVLILSPVLAIYMLIELPRTKRIATELVPPRIREEVVHVARQATLVLGAFVRGQLLVAFIVGLLSTLMMRALDLPFWLIVGMTAGVLNLVPFVGPIVGGGLAAIVALVYGDLQLAVLAVAIFTGIQQLDNHIVTPLVQKTMIRMSPTLIVLALIIGGSVAGFLGVLIAVPAMSVFRVVAGHIWRTRMLGESWQEASEKMIEVVPPPERIAGIRRRSTRQQRLFDTAELGAVDLERVDEEQTEDTEPVPPPRRP